MAELQRSAPTSQVYERLIDRLNVALDSANTAVQLRDERPVELELRGLSHAELELINLYLNRTGREAIERSQGSRNMQDAPKAKVIWLKDRVQGA
ncbi:MULTISPECIES: hypothetical protein [Pseudomonas]|jgi:hypothetical protein|uniref:Uncharacterized protein n=1 Tax=Pseudomonas psychrophila TaxID=122355 RepID=A0A8I1FKN9_9PSED|nr:MULTISPECIES: hypothetical protein [Pseudomonas]EPJ95103.1 hypothetical protein CF149_07054 [Pseudomonas psychrophila]MBJ2256041.1 hypothetical protein [Pseudomonas psychrophila]MDY7583524.1 hypothetical protein [Pseudomonas sp. CCI3.1]MEB0065780.1 hypothetical protein [Pseudomonas sp. CCI3.1]MEB0070920.1 hypothetical protein [Pseudomonas sp. CCI1.4]